MRLRTSIVVTFANRYPLITNFAAALARSADLDRCELVVAFDGAHDTRARRALHNVGAGSYKFLSTPERVGYAKINNLAARSATGDALVFMNSDVLATPDAINALVQQLGDETIGATQALLLYPQTGLVQSAGHVFFDRWNYHALAGGPADRRAVQTPAGRQGLTTAFCAMRREVFNGASGFDEFYFNGWEGLDLTLRISTGGLKCMYWPKAIGYHIQSASGRSPADGNPQELGYFWSRWGNVVRDDMLDLIAAQLSPSILRFTYNAIDFSTAPHLFAKTQLLGLQVSDLYSGARRTRGPIVLENLVPFKILSSQRPMAIFVDRATDVTANKLTTGSRSLRNDVVIDLRGNVLSLGAINGARSPKS